MTVTPETAAAVDAALAFEALALPLLGVAQKAAIACAAWCGRGDADAADAAAVGAMREGLGTVPGSGRVVIGEGEKDEAPMLYAGEEVGAGGDPAFDLAIDPLEGTSYCAAGLEGAIAVMAAAPRGSLWATPGFYMEKMVVGPKAAGTIDLNDPVAANLERVAEAVGKPMEEVTVVILDKPRHSDLIEQVRAAGPAVIEIPAGDVMGSLRALVPAGGVDVCLGVGGAPEGVITACAVRLLGGSMQARLAPQSDKERELLQDEKGDVDRVLTAEDLVTSPFSVFVATGVTNGFLLTAPEQSDTGWRTRSLLVTSGTGVLVVDSLG
jgi:fructose-1,6-bisphosphatase II